MSGTRGVAGNLEGGRRGGGRRGVVGNWEGGRGGGGRRACVLAWSGPTRPGSSCASASASALAPAPALSPAAASASSTSSTALSRSVTFASPTLVSSFPPSSPVSSPISLMHSRSLCTASRYDARPASGGVAGSASPLHARAVLDARKPQMRASARSGSSATSGVAGSSERGVAVREREGVPFKFAVLRRSAALGGITTLGSRNVTCRPGRRGPGAGMMDFKRRTKRKVMTAMASIRLVAQNTKRVWKR